jgi:hypothetical protein
MDIDEKIKVTDPAVNPVDAYTKQELRRWIYQILEHHDWSAYELRKRTGLSLNEITTILNDDKRNMGFFSVVRIANAANFPVPTPKFSKELVALMPETSVRKKKSK